MRIVQSFGQGNTHKRWQHVDSYPPERTASTQPPSPATGTSTLENGVDKSISPNMNQESLEQVLEQVDDIASDASDIEFLKVVKVVDEKVCKPMDVPRKARKLAKWPCEGIHITFPEGTNQHTSYPFGIHSEHSILWNYRSVDDKFYLQAKACQKSSSLEGGVCKNCQKLTSSSLYAGIMHRIKFGAHENIPLVYHGVGALIAVARRKTDQIEQLRLSKLNDSRKLLVKASTLEDHKQWILAIASGRVDRVASLVQAGLKHRAGIKTLIQQYERAAEKLYKPKGYTNEDIMRSIVLLRLGGARVAEFAHQSLALPSLTTIRRQTVLPALLVSPSAPTVAEVEANIISCYSSLASYSGQDSEGSSRRCTRDPQPVIHQVLMLDELAVEKRVRWDDLHNKFQGTCREHNHRIPLEFTSEKELGLLCGAIENDEVHLATEVCVSYSM